MATYAPYTGKEGLFKITDLFSERAWYSLIVGETVKGTLVDHQGQGLIVYVKFKDLTQEQKEKVDATGKDYELVFIHANCFEDVTPYDLEELLFQLKYEQYSFEKKLEALNQQAMCA